MAYPPTERTPYEVWERILFFVISIDPVPLFSSTCTPSTYLSFKRTCGDGDSTVYQHDYRISERYRRSLRLVCRSWNGFAERWDTKERWMRFSSLPGEVSDERWKGVQRLEFISSSSSAVGSTSSPGAGVMSVPDGNDAFHGGKTRIKSILFTWKMLGVQSGYGGMRLRRLEMLHLTPGEFDGVLGGLCDASVALKELTSLAIVIPQRNGRPLRRLSTFFPQLVHLTLRASFAPEENGLDDVGDDDFLLEDMTTPVTQKNKLHDSLRLQHLETLFLFPIKALFRLTNWSLPKLRHFHIRPVTESWKRKVFPFLERHALTIETLDLEDELDSTAGGLVNPLPSPSLVESYDPRFIDFWNTFPHLKLLRCTLSRGRFATYPVEGTRNGAGHTLECLVNTDPIVEASDLIKVLSPWVEEHGVKRLESIVLFGPYFSRGVYKTDRGSVRGLLQMCQWNGIRVVNPAGKPWIRPL